VVSALPSTDSPVQPVLGDTVARRAVDVVAAAVGLAASSPLLAAIALAVRLDSPGPAVFRQARVGVGGAPFLMYKFRTMVVDAESVGPAVSGNADPRVTRVGALLRKTKLDELPQLLNVLRGDMTLIGPRAEVPAYVAHYSTEELQTLQVRPGLTGPGGIWFTVSQAAELDASADPEKVYITQQLPEKLALDLEYLRSRTPWEDVKVLFRTVAVSFRRG
jgi:lipopolysaccharide/colanic/teichoic acid biosynthesis glycosyltransferase